MGIFDFLFGTPSQTGQLDAQTKAARDFLLNQMLMQYSAGPVNVPQYMAAAPQSRYSGTNALLSSLGLENVAQPPMPTTNIGGIDVYTSEPFQTQMEESYAQRAPAQYDYLRSFYMDPVTGQFGERSYGYADPMAAQTAAPVQSSNNDDPFFNYHASGLPQSSGATQISGPTGTPSIRPRMRPSEAETTFGSDLSRSLTDNSYDPPGTVLSRAIDRMFGRG